jgi:BarA-like signal transduction histidine kinase
MYAEQQSTLMEIGATKAEICLNVLSKEPVNVTILSRIDPLSSRSWL